MLSILPLVSPLHDAGLVAENIARLGQWLEAGGLDFSLLPLGSGVPSGPVALLLVTGGTEGQAMQALEAVKGPAVLLAQASQNSLPAAMEVLAACQQQGRRGRIVPVGEGQGVEGLKELTRLLEVAWQLRGKRLGRLGAPSGWLVASQPGAEVVKAAWGVKLVEMGLEEVVTAWEGVAAEVAGSEGARFVAEASALVEPSRGEVDRAAAVYVALRQVVARHRLDAFTLRCFDLVIHQHTTGCLALSRLLDEGLVAGCEGDVPAALTMLWMQLLTGQVPFMANPQEIDVARGSLWLAHCTIARSLAREHRLRSHFESSLGVGIEGQLTPGPVTLARVGGKELRSLSVLEGRLSQCGVSDQRCRTQVEVEEVEGVERLLHQPLGNHLVLVRGHHARLLQAYHQLFIG